MGLRPQPPERKNVALRKESVDRNRKFILFLILFITSLSARRAWIEITIVSTPFLLFTVALRKESVDRNIVFLHFATLKFVSLSARRAWIEITRYISSHKSRNCRSPQGERG